MPGDPRLSGCLPVDAGFSLVAWQIDALTETEAEASLHDLDDRMRAIEGTYQRETGEPWPLDEIPEGYPQYEELFRRYQAAWDEIFVGRSDDCGERGMADLYARDPEEFERRYQAGCRQLREADRVSQAVERADDLVAVASCLDPPIARRFGPDGAGQGGDPDGAGQRDYLLLVLALQQRGGRRAGVCSLSRGPTCPEVLTAACAKPTESLPPWMCPSCGQRVAGQWAVCWQCGRAADGAPSEQPAEDVAAPPGGEANVVGGPLGTSVPAVAAAIAMIVLVVISGLEMIVILAPLAVVFILFMQQFQPILRSAVRTRRAATSPNRPQRGANSASAIVRRAWQSAMIGLCVFPPLSFYSTWLLLKLGERDTPLGRADRWRCRDGSLYQRRL